MPTQFVKMQGLSNDFIVIQAPISLSSSQVAHYCDRHLGIGADGLIVVTLISDNEVKMDYWNADGSTDTICGNGLRCVTRFAVERGLVEPGTFRVKTALGERKVIWDGKSSVITVQVGKARLVPKPVWLFGLNFYKVDLGNPHAIAFVDDYDNAPVVTIGPKVEVDRNFPDKTNVEFVKLVSKNRIRMKVWERGVGQTKACGTGMVASAAAASSLKNMTLPIEVETLGGVGKVSIDEEDYYLLTGPAVFEYTKELPS